MPRSGPRTVRRYSDDFKLAAVRLSDEPRVQVQTVAPALAIHPFMLSKWRKDAREGRLRGAAAQPTARTTRELARLQMLEREYALLQEEHDLLKKAIRFCSARKGTSSRSSRASSARPMRSGG
jgi:transposase